MECLSFQGLLHVAREGTVTITGFRGGGLCFMKSSSLGHRPRPKAETTIQNAV